MSTRLRVAVVAAVIPLALTACTGDDGTVDLPSAPQQTVDVDTPELRRMRADAGLEPCEPGPGGGALPAVTLECLGGGKAVDLSTLRGPMVINLWASWCGPCKKEMPILEEFHQKHGDRVAVMGIDFEVYPVSAFKTIQETGVTYPSLADPLGELQPYPEFEDASFLPVLYFLDDSGEISHSMRGGVHSLGELTGLVETHLEVDLG